LAESQTIDSQSVDLGRCIEQALNWLVSEQDPAGFWAGKLESNCCMEAEWLLAFFIIGYDFHHTDDLLRGILQRQRPDGSWETYHDAPSGDINATVECYAALRIYGHAPESEPLQRARQWILANGGLARLRVFTRYWLALIGEWSWDKTPNLPPEVIRFPLWFPFSIYNFASWARATLVPLAVLSARRYVRHPSLDRRLEELFPEGRSELQWQATARAPFFSWRRFFLFTDRVLHDLQDIGLTPGRRASVARCLEWIIRHQDADGAWGGIQPPWIYSIMALHAEGYSLDHPLMQHGLGALDTHWSYRKGDSLRIQASESPVWDTLLSLMALSDCDQRLPDQAGMVRAVRWVLEHEVRLPGDWAVKIKNVAPGGWAFERANRHYPDVDDTAVAVILLARLREQWTDPTEIDGALDRAVNWMTAMQCNNGGWAAFDRNNDRQLLAKIPFCDFGEALDPPSADVTAHVLEALGTMGRTGADAVVSRGLRFLRREQEPGGSWFGRWGVNHVYGTAAVLTALHAIGENLKAPYVTRAAEWLVAHQNADGGWGESCASYMDASQIGRGRSTASQTGWAIMGLLAVDAHDYKESLVRGVRWLVAHQVDGTWEEPEYTGTGFPGYGVGARTRLEDPALSQKLQQGTELQRGFMLNYNLYRHYFPLMALGRYRRLMNV
jgi:squalene-hopene/tetraprenyl-beta-curcumene cyclase